MGVYMTTELPPNAYTIPAIIDPSPLFRILSNARRDSSVSQRCGHNLEDLEAQSMLGHFFPLALPSLSNICSTICSPINDLPKVIDCPTSVKNKTMEIISI